MMALNRSTSRFEKAKSTMKKVSRSVTMSPYVANHPLAFSFDGARLRRLPDTGGRRPFRLRRSLSANIFPHRYAGARREKGFEFLLDDQGVLSCLNGENSLDHDFSQLHLVLALGP